MTTDLFAVCRRGIFIIAKLSASRGMHMTSTAVVTLWERMQQRPTIAGVMQPLYNALWRCYDEELW